VFYDAGSIPARYRNVYDLNPLVHVIGAYRSIFLRNEFPVAGPLVLTGVISAALLALTFTLFARARYRFIEEL
jgi:lipopolysaccharide transport system permease protein